MAGRPGAGQLAPAAPAGRPGGRAPTATAGSSSAATGRQQLDGHRGRPRPRAGGQLAAVGQLQGRQRPGPGHKKTPTG